MMLKNSLFGQDKQIKMQILIKLYIRDRPIDLTRWKVNSDPISNPKKIMHISLFWNWAHLIIAYINSSTAYILIFVGAIKRENFYYIQLSWKSDEISRRNPPKRS